MSGMTFNQSVSYGNLTQSYWGGGGGGATGTCYISQAVGAGGAGLIHPSVYGPNKLPRGIGISISQSSPPPKMVKMPEPEEPPKSHTIWHAMAELAKKVGIK